MLGRVPMDPSGVGISQMVYATVYMPKFKANRNRFPASCVDVHATAQAAIDAAQGDVKRFPAHVLGPSKSSEGQYCITWWRGCSCACQPILGRWQLQVEGLGEFRALRHFGRILSHRYAQSRHWVFSGRTHSPNDFCGNHRPVTVCRGLLALAPNPCPDAPSPALQQ